ncbi:ATP-binding cassette domain-containing protein [Methylobacterium oryzihabitans]|uniref:ATP-binding cassette domain-containing protein n=1 Tax=Methylobacterium oryzihabitans TaxID=2499852 RepID=A0A3S2V832_9HYPH|nr:ATP-binding cassette domain-containing protein [Methylobacterium oryzihabitans]RVU16163.1 ATP-binding cassette domain-containing protein [Methylobacterium oryzihabitans]
MDRDPVAFAWRTAPRQHAAAIVTAVGLGGPLVGLGLMLLRDLVDDLLGGRDPSERANFLHLHLPLPDRLGGGILTLVRGWPLADGMLAAWALGGLAAIALALAGLGWVVGRLCFAAQGHAVRHLRERATAAILGSGPAGREEARALAAQVGEGLRSVDGLLAVGILVPALAGGAALLAAAVAAVVAPRLVAAAAVGLVAITLARLLLLARGRRRATLRGQEAEAIALALGDLVRRLPAVRAHGTGSFETARLGHAATAARRALARAELALARARAPALALTVLLPTTVIATALWRGEGPGVSAGGLAALLGALTLAASLIATLLRQGELRQAALPAFREIARLVAALEGRARNARRTGPFLPLPAEGALVLSGVAAYDPASGERLTGLDFALTLPAHVAIVGPPGSGGRVLAALFTGQLEPTVGAVTYAGTDLRRTDPAERARRLAYVGGEPVLMAGSLLQNLLYGDLAFADGTVPDAAAEAPPPQAAHLEERLVEALTVTGLNRLVYARGLANQVARTLDPATVAAIVETRIALREALAREGAAHLIESFDPGRYNRQATVGENLLFGEPVGATFSEAQLAGHPFTRAVLEAEGLTRPMAEMGLSIARASAEIFSDLPDDHPLFEDFSLFPASERGFFEDLVARQPEATGWRRGPAGQRDRARLIGLSLRYSEIRHRFGLIDDAFEGRLVAARRTFASLLPASLRHAVEFYDPDQVTAAASLEENLLFGRIAQGEAGAGARVRTLMRQVLAERGLERTVYRLGLASRVDPRAAESSLATREGAFSPAERVAIDIARCLVRRPDLMVIGIPLEERGPAEIQAGLTRLRAACAGRGLVVCLPDERGLPPDRPFDLVLRTERNTVVGTADAPPARPEAAPGEPLAAAGGAALG